MSERRAASQDDERTPPLAQDLVPFTWKIAEGSPAASDGQSARAIPGTEEISEVDALRAQVKYFTGALEDIVTLALSNADYKERAIMMHRRAVAALSSAAGRPLPSATK